MLQYPEGVEQTLLDLAATHFPADETDQVRATIAFAKSLESVDPHHPTLRVYFSHPLRVATLALRLTSPPDLEIVKTALLHNVFEVSGLEENDLVGAGYSERLARGIRLLTIDRHRQYDPEYLAEFYNQIESFGADLALIKCVDKLDNLLAFELFERTPQIEVYLEMCDRFVAPMAQRLSEELGDYVSESISYARTSGCRPDLKAKYELFVSQANAAAQAQEAAS